MDRSIFHRCRPRRSAGSMPGRAIREAMPRPRSQAIVSVEW